MKIMLQKVFTILKFMYLLQRLRKRNKPQNLKTVVHGRLRKKSTGRKIHALYKMCVL